MKGIAESELILNSGQRVYHLDLFGNNIADDVILVGDPDRVDLISKHFQSIESKHAHREFITHTGNFNGKRVTVLSSGIGPDNIDIVMNELDAAVNVDLQKREEKVQKRGLNIYRLGTCGALQPDVPVDSFIVSSHTIGMDGLLNFYQGLGAIDQRELSSEFIKQCNWPQTLAYPYSVTADPTLIKKFSGFKFHGITVTAPGFYGPQGRRIRLDPAFPQLNEQLTAFNYQGLTIMNYEMETSAIYGLGRLLGHCCLTVCVAIANRTRGEFSSNPQKSIEQLIEQSLTIITQ